MRPARLAKLLLLVALFPAALPAQRTRVDSLDVFIREQMAARHIRGLSLAIIQEGKIALARAWGVTDGSSRAPVTTATLFQAGSISKPVSALGALHLVEAGKLSLDGNVNEYLTSWKVPENRFTTTEKVTLRRLLSHSAGLTVHGFPGYDIAAPVPTVVQVLDGAAPSNTAAIRVDTTPGAISRYSGGGFTVMQQMVVDVSGTSFPKYLQETVLGPIGMTGSSFEQPQPPARARLTAAGYYGEGQPVRGRWHVYPEMAAAGLWTTPTDLAKFAIEIQQTVAGGGHGVISPEMARQYVTELKGGFGLGVGVSLSGKVRLFSHNGRDEGFDAILVAEVDGGHGLVVMINGNDNSRLMSRIRSYVNRVWGQAEGSAPAPTPTATSGVSVSNALLDRYAGYFELANGQMLAFAPDGRSGNLETLADGLPDEPLLAIDSASFGSKERQFRAKFVPNAAGAIDAALLRFGTATERRFARVAPLPSSLRPSPDSDPDLSARIGAVLRLLPQGPTALATSPDATAGAKANLGWANPSLAGSDALTYLGEENVEGRGIVRLGGQVARVRSYRFTGPAGVRYLLVHLTGDGKVTDYDVVVR